MCHSSKAGVDGIERWWGWALEQALQLQTTAIFYYSPQPKENSNCNYKQQYSDKQTNDLEITGCQQI